MLMTVDQNCSALPWFASRDFAKADVFTLVKFEGFFELNSVNSSTYKNNMRVLLVAIYKHCNLIETVFKFGTGQPDFFRQAEVFEKKGADPSFMPELHKKWLSKLLFK